MKLTSRDNPKVRHWAKLARDARYRKAERHALLEGPHLVQAFQATGGLAIAILVTEKALGGKEIADLAGKSPVVVSESVFRSIVDAENPPGIAAEIAIPEPRKAQGDVVFLEGVQDPSNVGAIIRSAAAFGIGEVTLDQTCADPWSPRALRAGMGGHFALSVRQQARLELNSFNGTLVCTVVRGGTALDKADLQGRLGWIFGAEGQGVSPEAIRHTDLKVTIPMIDGTESLNVAAAAAICLYARSSISQRREP
jgi:TrmH family RNA methyltransferase